MPIDLTPQIISSQFKVNTFTGNNQFFSDSQGDRQVAALSSGGFVVTWQAQNEDGSEWGIYAQRYTDTGAPAGPEFRVNSTWANDQLFPSITALAVGGFVITWQSYLQEGGSNPRNGVYAQRYSESGEPNGSEFRLNTTTNQEQSFSAVSALSDGGFVAIWHSFLQDGNDYGIFGRRFDSNGNALSGEFPINQQTAGNQVDPSLTTLADGGFVVTWETINQDGNGYGIYGRRYLGNGSPANGEFRVNTSFIGDQVNPSVAALTGGGFVVTWQSTDDGSSLGIFGQRYDAAGAATGAEFRVNARTPGDQTAPQVSAMADGGFLVAWQSTGADDGIFGQRFAANGTALGSEFLLNTEPSAAGAQYAPSITALANGNVAAVWTSVGQGGEFASIRGQLFALPLTPEPATGELAVNTFTIGGQNDPDIASLTGGGFVVTWTDQARGIYARLFAADGTAIGNEFKVDTLAASSQVTPSVRGLSNGNFLVTWRAVGPDGSGEGIVAKLFAANGAVLHEEFVVNSVVAGNQAGPVIAPMADGKFAVIYRTVVGLDVNKNIAGRLFDAAGNQIDSEFTVNTNLSGDQDAAQAAGLKDGGFVAIWNYNGDVFGQRYDATGARVGAEFRANQTALN